MPALKNVDTKREREEQIERIATAVAAAVAVIVALRRLIHALAELSQ
jgi:hypothetical protein